MGPTRVKRCDILSASWQKYVWMLILATGSCCCFSSGTQTMNLQRNLKLKILMPASTKDLQPSLKLPVHLPFSASTNRCWPTLTVPGSLLVCLPCIVTTKVFLYCRECCSGALELLCCWKCALWVSCPKNKHFASDHAEKLDCFSALGHKHRAPAWY